MAIVYKGFSSIGKTRPFTELTDEELIKRDILNHFNTRKGARVMRPTYGSALWDFIFEPFDQLTRDAIIDDATTVINSEPRVEKLSLNIQDFDHGIILAFQLKYKDLGTIDTFTIGFDRRNMQAQEISL